MCDDVVCIHLCVTCMSVPKLGFLFEFYMSCASSWSANKKWISLCNRLQDDEPMSANIQDQLEKDYGTKFIGWLLWHVLNIGNKGKMQMFYISFCAHFFGLSRQGIELMAKYGYGVTIDMFDDTRNLYLARSVETTRYYFCLL